MTPPLVMLVDDEAPFVETMAKRLGKRDLNVILAFSGQEALEILDNQRNVDVVILDVKMPGLSGLDVLRRIKAEHPHIAVIMLTGHGSKRDAEEGMRLGAYDYLVKPVRIGVLSQFLQDAAGADEDRTDE